MIIPIGHEESGVRRLPWVTFSIMIVCVLSFLVSGQGSRATSDDAEVSARVVAAAEYWSERAYLELDPELSRLAFPAGPESRQVRALATLGEAVTPPGDPQELAAEQATLDRLTHVALAAYRGHPLARFGLVPSRWSAPDLLTHMFLHAGWLHLLGNLLIFYIAGPMLEDVWGRPLYLGLYLAAGIAAATAHVVSDPGSAVPMIGASGAIAGVMGAFLVRYAKARIRFFYAFGLLVRGTFSAPSWVMLPLWFGEQLFMALLTGNTNGNGGVAYWAHVGGFAFGALAAVVVRRQRIEQRFVARRIETKIHTTVVDNRAVEDALGALEAGRAEEAADLLCAELTRSPENFDAALALEAAAADLGRTEQVAPLLLGAIEHELRRGRTEAALELYEDLVAKAPGFEPSVGSLLRIAQASIRIERPEFALQALRGALMTGGTGLAAPTALRIARMARDLDPRLALGAARIALAASESDPDGHEEAREIVTRLTPPTVIVG